MRESGRGGETVRDWAPPGGDVRGLRAVVVGAARSGIAAARLLASRGAQVTLTDLQPALPAQEAIEGAGIRLALGGHEPALLSAADLVVVSPGVPPRQPALEAARAAGVPVIGELEFASRFLSGRLVAITGTKGKSTTTTLAGRMLEAGGHRVLVGGNIGVPLSDQVAQTAPGVVHVVEASSFQLETTTRFHPAIAVYLNFSPDHLDRHASIADYAAAKARIFANQERDDHAVVNADDAPVIGEARRGRAQLVPFSVSRAVADGVCVSGAEVCWAGQGGALDALFPVSSVRLLGRHLLGDVLAAAAVARLLGVGGEAMRTAVEGFAGLEHALEPVAEVDGVQFVNDSKATNVEAARRAIESFASGLVVIMGGRFKGGDLGLLREPLARRAVRVVGIGEARPLLREALADAVAVEEAASLRDAVERAAAAAPRGGTVLLAPACASFDMFRDYAERGRAFKEEVARLAAAARHVRER